MKNEDQTENSILTQQTNSLFQLWRELKNSIFNVLFVLLNQSDDDEDESIFGLTFEAGLDYLQMMAFPFNTAVISVWNGGETLSSFFSIFTNLSFSNYIPNVQFGTFLIMLYLLIFVIILVIMDIIYVSYSFSKKKFAFTWPLEFLAKVVPLCVTVFFLPIMETLLSVVSCQNSQDIPGVQVMQNFPDIICWQGWHMFHAVVTLFFTSIFVFISSIVALTIFEPRMTTNSLTARQNSSGQVIFILNKMILQFVFSFTPFDDTFVYCVMLFVLSGWLWTCYNVDQPFHNKNASKFFRICSTYYFWTNTMLFVSQLLLQYGFEGGLVVWMCGLPFIGFSIVFERKSNIDKLFSSNLKFRSGQQLQSHLQYVLQLIHNRDKDKNSYMLLLGYIEKHIEVCTEDDCPLRVKRLKKEEDLAEIEQNCQHLIKQLLRMFKQGVKKYPTCTRLRLSFAFFYMQHLQDNNSAYQQFTIAQTTEPTFGEQFIIYRFKKIIRENLEEETSQDEDNDLIEIIRFDNHVSLCEEAMLTSARLHKDFWTELEQETPNLKKLNDIGSQITQTTTTVKQNYKQIQKINSHVSEVIHNYAIYLIFIGQSHQEGKKLLQHAKRIYFERKQRIQSDMSVLKMKNSQYSDLKLVEQSHSGVIKVSVENGMTGRIVHINQIFTQITGYLKEDINGRPIDKILPEVYSLPHRAAVNQWIANDDKKFLSRNNSYLSTPHKGHLRHKNGFLIPIDYRVSFNIEQNTFLTIIKPDTDTYTQLNNKIFLITNLQGVIKDISQLGYLHFGICKQQLQNRQIYLQQLGIPKQLDQEELLSPYGTDIKINKSISFKTIKSTTFTNKTIPLLKNNLKSQHDQDSKQDEITDLQFPTNEQTLLEDFNIRAEEIWMTYTPEVEETLDHQAIIKNGKIKIGYIYTLSKTFPEPLIKPNQNLYPNDQLNIFEDFLEDIYQEDDRYIFPEAENQEEQNRLKKSKILAEMLLEMNKGAKIIFEQQKFRNYAEELKIKTYRFFNNDFHRIYAVQYEQQSLNSQEFENDELTHANSLTKKMQKAHYQQKVKQAINTKIQHKQIINLRRFSIFFLLILCALSVWGFIEAVKELQKIQYLVEENYLHVKDIEFITTNLQYTVNDQLKPYKDEETTKILQQAKKHQLVLDPDEFILVEMEDNRYEHKSLLEVMNLIKARIVGYFDPKSLVKDIIIAYRNYMLSAYPVIETHTMQSTVTYSTSTILLSLQLVNCLIMTLLWIYTIATISQKRFDIMLWFLDIPIDYVIYLQHNCNRFIKNYISIKELQLRGISVDDKEHYCDEYEEKEKPEDEQIDEQNKTRKILISRHKKKTFLQKLQLSYLKTLWLIAYGTIISIVFTVEIYYQQSHFQFINQQWNLIAKEYIWASTFTIVEGLEAVGYKRLENRVGEITLDQFEDQLRQNFLNVLTQSQKTNDVKLLVDQTQEIAQIYANVYYGDLCELIGREKYGPVVESRPNQQHNDFINKCSSLLSHKLHTGLTTYFTIITNHNSSIRSDIITAHQQIISPSMILIFKKWKDYFVSTVDSFKSISTITIYIYLVLTLIGFITLWMMYLKNQNNKMNRTIQMLNMIPMNMLPKNIKDTRTFLDWLIKEANANKQTP